MCSNCASLPIMERVVYVCAFCRDFATSSTLFSIIVQRSENTKVTLPSGYFLLLSQAHSSANTLIDCYMGKCKGYKTQTRPESLIIHIHHFMCTRCSLCAVIMVVWLFFTLRTIWTRALDLLSGCHHYIIMCAAVCSKTQRRPHRLWMRTTRVNPVQFSAHARFKH